VLCLVNGTGWPAREGWRPGDFTHDAVMPAGDSRPRLALTGYHRDRHKSGAGRLR
jgi:hypothetical protein